MDVTIRQIKSGSTGLPFLEDDIVRFDFESNSDTSTENYASSTVGPFECQNVPVTKLTKSNYLGSRMALTDTFMTFTDLDGKRRNVNLFLVLKMARVTIACLMMSTTQPKMNFVRRSMKRNLLVGC